MNYKAKDIMGKITNLFCIHLFVINLPTKLEIYYLQYNYVLIYIIHGDRTIISFVGVVANLRHGQRP
jgi:hypothetical protein